ncbi:hypothetical protein B0H12DRAFT_1136595 [Mycena haematopus]|nr:hypothetical protein B0H12DRAFT_1136595 [Mycena haematopus]
MFSYFYSRPPNEIPTFPPGLMKTWLAAQEQQICAYMKCAEQIHQDEKCKKENALLGEDDVVVAEQRLSVDRDSASKDSDSVWEELDLADDIGNQSPVRESPFADPVPEGPVYMEWLNEIHSEERLNEDHLIPVELPPSPRPETPLSVVDFLEWLEREEKMDKENLSRVAATPNRGSVPTSPVSAVHSIQNMHSLHDMFPDIPLATITKIVEHEFKPMDLARLNPTHCGDNFEGGCSLRDYPSLHSLIVPICLYFSVLQAGVSAISGDVEVTRTIGESGLRYVAHLIELEELYQWPAVVQYHMQFHNKRRHDMVFDDYSSWRVADKELINELLVGRLHGSGKQLGRGNGSAKSFPEKF